MKQHKAVRFGNPAALSLLSGLLAGCLLWALVAAADSPPKVPQGKHGDASAEYQLAELQKLKLEQDVTKAPAGLDPVVWAAYRPRRQQDDAGARGVGAETVFRYAALAGQLRFLRHLPRRDARLHRPAGDLGGDQGTAWQAERADDAQRGPAPDVLLGRPLAEPGPPGQACRSSTRSRWGCPTKRPP